MPTDTARRGAAQGRQIVAAALTAAPVIAGVLAAALASRSTSQALSLLGLPDPGLLTTLGIPALTAAGEVCAAIAVGSLLLSAFVLPPQRTGVLDLDGYLA
ncbi:MAG: copper resistance protein CopD, partial [Rhodococcus sp. (in: high G+C Gram-positive bacteria)]